MMDSSRAVSGAVSARARARAPPIAGLTHGACRDSTCRDLANFISAIFVVSSFGIPVVLAHAHEITVLAMVLTLVGTALIFLTGAAYMRFFGGRADDEDYSWTL